MRKLLASLVLIVIFFVSPAFAGGIGNVESGEYDAISSSQNVMPLDGVLLGIFVSSASNTPTITVYDSATTTTTTTAVAQFTPTGATFYPMKINLMNGAYIAIGGTVSLTAVTVPQ